MAFYNDLFISYAHIDDEPMVAGELGWIAVFHNALEVRLKQLVGRHLRIWRDVEGLEGNVMFADRIVSQFSKTALMISIISPRYVRSEWCVKEVVEFANVADTNVGFLVEDKSRIFKVIKTPVGHAQHPEIIRETLGYEFYIINPINKKTREFNLHNLRAEYEDKLDELAQDIASLLDKVNDKMTALQAAEKANQELQDKKDKEEKARLAKLEAEAPKPFERSQTLKAVEKANQDLQDKKDKEEKARIAKLEAENLENERLAKLAAEKANQDLQDKKDREEKARQDLQDKKDREEKDRIAKLETERLENERLEQIAADKIREYLQDKKDGEEEEARLAKLEAEKLEKERLAKLEEEYERQVKALQAFENSDTPFERSQTLKAVDPQVIIEDAKKYKADKTPFFQKHKFALAAATAVVIVAILFWQFRGSTPTEGTNKISQAQIDAAIKADSIKKANENKRKTDSIKIAEINRMSDPNEIPMVPVQGGIFQMGSNEYDNEKPIHSVTLSSFSIGKYEVTQALWTAVMGDNPSYYEGDNLPVEQVSWDNIQDFLKKLNIKTGKKYRLPTEAEWEYAARGGNKSRGYTYSGSNNLGDVAWTYENSGGKTHPVGQKQANELGIYDMSGNVWEWCSDWYDEKYYANSPSNNPKGAANGSNRVDRGGGWGDGADGCRVAIRYDDTPVLRGGILGFRLVRPD